jgi:glutamate dehydrogenase
LLPDLDEDVLFILLPENTLTPEIAELISCKAIVELLPGQINPVCDDILYKRNIMVIPDIVCSSSIEIVESWWLGGNKVPDWPMALYLRLSELCSKVQSRRCEKNICNHEAALLLALERLTERWNA